MTYFEGGGKDAHHGRSDLGRPPWNKRTQVQSMGGELLQRLFRRHFPDADNAIRRLAAHLSGVGLPFSIEGQLRETIYPPQPGLPDGLPSAISYFVPGTRQGSDQPSPAAALSPAFLRTGDGIGLNFGCPLRLLRALDALVQLPPGDQLTPLACLRDPSQHLATVEELLWLTGWRASKPQRGGQLPGAQGDIDWKMEAQGLTLFLEAKFRRSDWARLIEGPNFLNAGDGFLSKAVHKFPEAASPKHLHVVGVTTFDDINEDIVNQMGLELRAAPQIHAVVVRSLLQMTHVIALRQEVADMVLSLLDVPSGAEFPCHYPVIFHIEQREDRLRQRLPRAKVEAVSVFNHVLAPVGITRIEMPDPRLYRLTAPSRGPDGEPVFEVIPKYLVRRSD